MVDAPVRPLYRRVERGRVRMLVNDFLSEAEVAEGRALTCQAVAESDDCEVEYPD